MAFIEDQQFAQLRFARLDLLEMASFAEAAEQQTDGEQERQLFFMALGRPEIADDIKRIGLDIVGRANNKSTTFGVAGMRATSRELDRVGIVWAGVGENSAAAARARYLETPNGRVGLVSVTANSERDARPAGDLSGGTPGANALHVSRTVTISQQSFDALRSAHASSPWMFPGRYPILSGPGRTYEERGERLKLFDNVYTVGDKPDYSYAIRPGDLEALVREVRNAKYNSNFVITTIHAHEWNVPENATQPDQEARTPPDFLVKVARASIDNGADIFYAHGEGELRGIEIYKNKPIFYQLGNFIRHPFLSPLWEQGLWSEAHAVPGYDPSLSNIITQAEVAGGLHPVQHSREYFESFVPVTRYENGKLSEIIIYPVDMKFDGPFADIGTPLLAHGATAQKILNIIKTESAKLGTTMIVRGDLGYIRIAQPAR